MRIRNIRHKGLKRLYQTGNGAGLPAVVVPKLTDMLTFLDAMADEIELHDLQHWKAHLLTGDRAGIWALHVTKNWRLTFAIDGQTIEIIDLDYEDYH